jgi:hypothetical protein
MCMLHINLNSTGHCGRRSIWICVGSHSISLAEQLSPGLVPISVTVASGSLCYVKLSPAIVSGCLEEKEKHSMKHLFISILFCTALYITFVHSKPTIYKINENDKLEPGRMWTSECSIIIIRVHNYKYIVFLIYNTEKICVIQLYNFDAL